MEKHHLGAKNREASTRTSIRFALRYFPPSSFLKKGGKLIQRREGEESFLLFSSFPPLPPGN
jgi:hypothetical protein